MSGAWESEDPNLVDCLGDLLDVGREYDRLYGQVTRNFSLTRKGGHYLAAYGGVTFAAPELWSAVHGLYVGLRDEVYGSEEVAHG